MTRHKFTRWIFNEFSVIRDDFSSKSVPFYDVTKNEVSLIWDENKRWELDDTDVKLLDEYSMNLDEFVSWARQRSKYKRKQRISLLIHCVTKIFVSSLLIR